jgi:spore germination cell wall hydrolase CwlJ-like protein
LIDQIAALTCLAQVAFMEARGEPPAGQIAVMMVLYRRAEFKPERICLEMARPYQFSWYGKIKPPERSATELRPFLNMAHQVLNLKVKDTSKGAYNFHEINLKPRPAWALQKPIKVTINNHIFY